MKFTKHEVIALVSALLCYFVLPIIVSIPIMMVMMIQNNPNGMMIGGFDDSAALSMISIVSFAFLVILAIILFIVYRQFLIDEFKKVKANPKRFLLFIAAGSVLFIVISIVLSMFIPSGANQETIEAIQTQLPIMIAIQAVVLAPFVEELLFRKVLYLNLKGTGKLSIDSFLKKQFPSGRAIFRILSLMVVSSLAFGLMHFGFGVDPWYAIFPYFAMGLMLVISYELSDMFYVPVVIHFANNFLSVVLMFLNF